MLKDDDARGCGLRKIVLDRDAAALHERARWIRLHHDDAARVGAVPLPLLVSLIVLRQAHLRAVEHDGVRRELIDRRSALGLGHQLQERLRHRSHGRHGILCEAGRACKSKSKSDVTLVSCDQFNASQAAARRCDVTHCERLDVSL